jgi:hypothetical protein
MGILEVSVPVSEAKPFRAGALGAHEGPLALCRRPGPAQPCREGPAGMGRRGFVVFGGNSGGRSDQDGSDRGNRWSLHRRGRDPAAGGPPDARTRRGCAFGVPERRQASWDPHPGHGGQVHRRGRGPEHRDCGREHLSGAISQAGPQAAWGRTAHRRTRQRRTGRRGCRHPAWRRHNRTDTRMAALGAGGTALRLLRSVTTTRCSGSSAGSANSYVTNTPTPGMRRARPPARSRRARMSRTFGPASPRGAHGNLDLVEAG